MPSRHDQDIHRAVWRQPGLVLGSLLGVSLFTFSCVVPGAGRAVPDWGVRTECQFRDELADDIESTARDFEHPSLGQYDNAVTCSTENSSGPQVVVRLVGSNESQRIVDRGEVGRELACDDQIEVLVPVSMSRSLGRLLASDIDMSGGVCALI